MAKEIFVTLKARFSRITVLGSEQYKSGNPLSNEIIPKR